MSFSLIFSELLSLQEMGYGIALLVSVSYTRHMITMASGVRMATLKMLRVNLGWSQKELAKAASISTFVMSRAENGHRITAAKAKAIADAFSRAYGKPISVTDIEGLNVE